MHRISHFLTRAGLKRRLFSERPSDSAFIEVRPFSAAVDPDATQGSSLEARFSEIASDAFFSLETLRVTNMTDTECVVSSSMQLPVGNSVLLRALGPSLSLSLSLPLTYSPE